MPANFTTRLQSMGGGNGPGGMDLNSMMKMMGGGGGGGGMPEMQKVMSRFVNICGSWTGLLT